MGRPAASGESQKTCRNGECFGKKASFVMRHYTVVLFSGAATGDVVCCARLSGGCYPERLLSPFLGKERPDTSCLSRRGCFARAGPFFSVQARFRPSGSGNNTMLYKQYINLTIVNYEILFYPEIDSGDASALHVFIFIYSRWAGGKQVDFRDRLRGA